MSCHPQSSKQQPSVLLTQSKVEAGLVLTRMLSGPRAPGWGGPLWDGGLWKARGCGNWLRAVTLLPQAGRQWFALPHTTSLLAEGLRE